MGNGTKPDSAQQEFTMRARGPNPPASTVVSTTGSWLRDIERPGVIHRPDRGLLTLFTPSYLIGLAILATMVLAAGIWQVIADSRVLAGLLSAGVIALGEDDPGLGLGVPSVELWIRSQQPVKWLIVLMGVILFAAVQLLKGYQFHRIARFVGIKGSLSQHLRAYLYGNALGRMLPYRIGTVAWASALHSQVGSKMTQIAKLVYVFKTFLLIEIATYAAVGLILAGLLTWAASLLPPLLILFVSWLIMRGSGAYEKSSVGFDVFAELFREPQTFVVLLLLSLVSFGFVELASYIVPVAFSSQTVPIVQDELMFVAFTPPVVVLAVVGGYIARLVPVTPGGIGQFELAFASVLIMNNLPLPSAVVVALLVSAVRYATGALVFGVSMLSYGIETDFQRVRALFTHGAESYEEEKA